MIRLTATDLPDVAQPLPATAPAWRLAPTIAPSIPPPAYRINPHARYGLRPGFTVVQAPMPAPIFVGRLMQAVFSAAGADSSDRVLDIRNITLNGKPYDWARSTERRSRPVPGTAWGDQTRINLYSTGGGGLWPAAVGDTLAADITLAGLVPIPDDNDNFTLDLAGFIGSNAFNVSRITTGGLVFDEFSGVGDPVTGQFRQDGSTVILYGGPGYLPRVFQPLGIQGAWSAEISEAIAVLATFDISTSAVRYLEQVDYLGSTYEAIAPQNLTTPALGQFFNTRDLITLIMPLSQGGWLRAPVTTQGAISTLKNVTY